MASPGTYRADIDCLRAVAVLFVIAFHWQIAGFGGGFVGVDIFFVVSGYLITGQIVSGLFADSFSFADFYLRRARRLLPALYATIFVSAVVGWFVLLPPAMLDYGRSAVSVFLFSSNILFWRETGYFDQPAIEKPLLHTWSLSVEEQFYLLWPALIVIAGPRRALIAAAVAVLAAPIVRTGSWELMRWSGDGIGHRFETVADAVAIGCLLAGARDWLHRSARYMKGLASAWFVLVPVTAVAGNMLHDHPVAHFLIGMSVMNVAVAATLDWCLTFHSGRVGRVLNAAPLVYVGTLSYSLYLWQQLFLNRSAANGASAFPLNLLLACAAALASFYLVERPSLQLRRRAETAWRRRRPAPAGAPLLRRQLDHEHVLPEGAL